MAGLRTRGTSVVPALKRKKGESKEQQMVRTAMHERKRGNLHSGSKKGPVVKDKKQAIAIGLSEARKAGADVPKPKRKKK